MQEKQRIIELSEEEKNNIKKKLLLELLDKKEVRKIRHRGRRYFSVVDIVGIFLFEKDHKKAKNYWNTLKNQAKTARQLVENKKHSYIHAQTDQSDRRRRSAPRSLVLIFNQLKKHIVFIEMEAADGKFYTTEAIPADSFLLLLKTLSPEKGERMRLWLSRETRLVCLKENSLL